LLGPACAGMTFDLISGGTCSGISGVAGHVAKDSQGKIRAFGYLPGYPPRGVKEDTDRFTQCFSSTGTDFTPMDPLQGWTDLIAFGIKPGDIRLLCYAPGEIARVECAVALALGANVGLVVDKDLAKERSFDSTAWEGSSGLLPLPKDTMTLRAYLQIADAPLSADEKKRLERAARLAHEDYVKSATPADASFQPWDKLADELKLSNYGQVAYWEKSLHAFGLGIRALTDDDKLHQPLVMADVLRKSDGGGPVTNEAVDPIRKLAEIEHGRWNVERLSAGWRYAEVKDVAKKLSPWLIPWEKVPDHIQKYDIDAINGLPKKLREAGLELYRL